MSQQRRRRLTTPLAPTEAAHRTRARKMEKCARRVSATFFHLAALGKPCTHFAFSTR